jgi:hypothetical protein
MGSRMSYKEQAPEWNEFAMRQTGAAGNTHIHFIAN